MEIENGILIDDWATFIARSINIDKSRINYNNYDDASLSISFTISESENDNVQKLYQQIMDNYHTISLTYPYLYQFE